METSEKELFVCLFSVLFSLFFFYSGFKPIMFFEVYLKLHRQRKTQKNCSIYCPKTSLTQKKLYCFCCTTKRSLHVYFTRKGRFQNFCMKGLITKELWCCICEEVNWTT